MLLTVRPPSIEPKSPCVSRQPRNPKPQKKEAHALPWSCAAAPVHGCAMYINRTRIRCGSLASGGLALAGSALISGAIFLPWWDVGDPKELLNLDNAPPVVATLWGFVFDNPPSWVTKPRGREASTWEAYCQRDAQALYTTTLTTLPLDILPDNPLHPGTCDMLPMLPTLLLTAAGLGPGAALCFFLARCGIWVLVEELTYKNEGV